jgi:phenylacetate-coenzyme A ligase PaaK-like adenylate-forming protein
LSLEYDLLAKKIENIADCDFEQLALEVFRYQAEHNLLYKEFLRLLGKDTNKIDTLAKIPFLPISFFKTHRIISEDWEPEAVFSSSGTTGNTTSTHLLRSKTFYTQNSLLAFEKYYGAVENYCILALLPSYLERTNSSLVYMTAQFIARSKYAESGFFLENTKDLLRILIKNRAENIPTLLLGVSFALWDLAEIIELENQNLYDFSNIILMETGGMKGRRKELTRPELHEILCAAFKTQAVHSEYGMTELLSQAYSKGNGVFLPAPTLRVLVRDATDPFTILGAQQSGALNIIDLANLATCSFIATDDLGKTYENGSFEVLGRLDTSDIRGCNLLLST